MRRLALGRCGSAPHRSATAVRAMAVGFALVVAAATPSPALAQDPGSVSTAAPRAPGSRIQPPWRMSVRADNDAFNFWRPITQRPDKEYTNGDLVTFELASAPLWGKRLAPRRAACTGTERDGVPCLMTAFAIGQDMYTPRPSREPRMVPDWQEDRPYAAWLYASASGRVISERSLRAVSLTLGVTGPAAFGEFAQRTAHQLTGVYSHEPIGWDTQIAFEPGVVLAVRDSRRFVARTASGRAVVDVVPHAGASLGNVLTAGDVGLQTRFGANLSHPWWTSEWRSRAPVELYVLAAVRGEAVARNITLDGNTLGADRRVDRVALVGEYTVGIGGRFRGLVAEWRAVTRGREYTTGPKQHAYSVLFAAIEVPARDDR